MKSCYLKYLMLTNKAYWYYEKAFLIQLKSLFNMTNKTF